MIEGIVCFAVCSINFRSYVLSFYYILFGALSIAAEFHLKFIQTHIRLLYKQIGRGLWYIFLGTIALGEQWWAILVAVILLVVGILNVCGGFMKSDQEEPNRLRSESMGIENQNEELSKKKGSFARKVEMAKGVKKASADIKHFEKAYDANLQPSAPPRVNAYDDY